MLGRKITKIRNLDIGANILLLLAIFLVSISSNFYSPSDEEILASKTIKEVKGIEWSLVSGVIYRGDNTQIIGFVNNTYQNISFYNWTIVNIWLVDNNKIYEIDQLEIEYRDEKLHFNALIDHKILITTVRQCDDGVCGFFSPDLKITVQINDESNSLISSVPETFFIQTGP